MLNLEKQISMKKNVFEIFAFWARNLIYREIFAVIEKYSCGDVLNVGGDDFFIALKGKNVHFDHWTVLEYEKKYIVELPISNYKCILGDGCNIAFENNRFDTVLNIQVIEHVFEPIRMFNEIARILKPQGHAIFLIPQTSVLHQAPHHYYNFTQFWFREAAKRVNMEIVELKFLGGVFTTLASHMLYFYFQILRVRGYSVDNYKRNILFYLLLPLMIFYTLINIPICLLLSLGDVKENANNYLVVMKKH